jgi:hypothetical protein
MLSFAALATLYDVLLLFVTTSCRWAELGVAGLQSGQPFDQGFDFFTPQPTNNNNNLSERLLTGGAGIAAALLCVPCSGRFESPHACFCTGPASTGTIMSCCNACLAVSRW